MMQLVRLFAGAQVKGNTFQLRTMLSSTMLRYKSWAKSTNMAVFPSSKLTFSIKCEEGTTFLILDQRDKDTSHL